MIRPEQIYLDHQASTPCDERVVEAMVPWFKERAANAHSSTHAPGAAAREAVENAREAVADLLGALPDEIVFTAGATEATNIALRGLLGKRGVHVVTSAVEHNSVRETLVDIGRQGVSVTEVAVDHDGVVDSEAFAAALMPKSALATVMAANNEIGTLQPVAALGAICRDRHVLFHTDAAQAAGKVPIDVHAMNIDLLSLSGHKLYGPQGIGALFCRKAVMRRLRPIMTGGGQERGLRPGTVPVALCVGLGEACRIARNEMDRDRMHTLALRDALLRDLTERLGECQVNGSLTERLSGNLNIWFPGVDAEALVARLPDVAISLGSACSSAAIEPSHVLLALGLSAAQAESSVRIGFGRSTTEAEVQRASKRIAEAVTMIRSHSAPTIPSRKPTMKRFAS